MHPARDNHRHSNSIQQLDRHVLFTFLFYIPLTFFPILILFPLFESLYLGTP